jgi:hypothetical protein
MLKGQSEQYCLSGWILEEIDDIKKKVDVLKSARFS